MIKKLYLSLLLIVSSLCVRAQVRCEPYDTRFCAEGDLLAGSGIQNLKCINYISQFTNPLNPNISNPKYSANLYLGGSINIGYFFDNNRFWGIGSGVIFQDQPGSVTMNNYHIEYQSTDFKHDIFRQAITITQPVKEVLGTTNINIPLVIKYKHELKNYFGLAIDAGILYNVLWKNRFTTNAAFDYEAIYKIIDGNKAVYDNSPVPSVSQDLLITQAEIAKTDPNAVAAQFSSFQKQGFNVGLGEKPKSGSGTVSYHPGSIGFILKPAITYELSYKVYLYFGGTFTLQNIKNDVLSYQITNKLGEYSSLLNSINTVQQISFGINFGVRVFIQNWQWGLTK